jgi:hypothetical protein
MGRVERARDPLVEASIRAGLSFALPVPVFLIVSPVLALAVTIALITWNLACERRSAQRGVERLAGIRASP